jgi:molybdopterin-containing oxidoreductase family membrane subunit
VLINVGMWFERFVIIVVSLHRAFLPSGWGMFRPTIVDVGVLVGSFGLFFTCFLLFIRALPMIAMWEIKGVVGQPGQSSPAARPAEQPARTQEVAGA